MELGLDTLRLPTPDVSSNTQTPHREQRFTPEAQFRSLFLPPSAEVGHQSWTKRDGWTPLGGLRDDRRAVSALFMGASR